MVAVMKTKLTDLQVIKGCLIFDMVSGTFYRVSESAGFIVEQMKEQIPIPTILVAYAARYQIS
jgi:hypothetical protein